MNQAPELAARFRCLADLEPAARERMPNALFEFVAGAAGDELTMADNKAAFDRLRLRPRVLRDVASIDTGVPLFGDALPHPILLAPTSFQRMAHPEGEVATARGAGQAGAVFVLSTTGIATIEECVAASAAPVWFLLYWQSDRGFNRELVARVEAGGARALCVTVDTPTLGDRRRQQRAGFEVPASLATPYFHDRNTSLRRAPLGVGRRADMAGHRVAALPDQPAPGVLKGILDPEDAARAIDSGADGIVLSNHGGRNIDTLPATADTLPAVAAQVDGRVPVLVDGGVRRGTDVLKCLALGASAVMIGRPYVFALALASAEGVSHCVGLLRREADGHGPNGSSVGPRDPVGDLVTAPRGRPFRPCREPSIPRGPMRLTASGCSRRLMDNIRAARDHDGGPFTAHVRDRLAGQLTRGVIKRPRPATNLSACPLLRNHQGHLAAASMLGQAVARRRKVTRTEHCPR